MSRRPLDHGYPRDRGVPHTSGRFRIYRVYADAAEKQQGRMSANRNYRYAHPCGDSPVLTGGIDEERFGLYDKTAGSLRLFSTRL